MVDIFNVVLQRGPSVLVLESYWTKASTKIPKRIMETGIQKLKRTANRTAVAIIHFSRLEAKRNRRWNGNGSTSSTSSLSFRPDEVPAEGHAVSFSNATFTWPLSETGPDGFDSSFMVGVG